MKWFSNRKQPDKRLDSDAPTRRLSQLKVVTVLACLAGTGIFLSRDASREQPKTLALISPKSLTAKVNVVATSITVRILSENFLGSGFIVQKKDNTYTIITNQHVLRAGEAPFQIQTPDGAIYPAKTLDNLTSEEYDLALLEFESAEVDYPIATVGSSSYLEIGEPIFAAGFPHTATQTPPEQAKETNSVPGFVLKKGRVTIFLDRALEEGYQIGYTNDVQKGMSGGPLLNGHGEVVGINGKHAYPLWEAPDFYQDGSQLCAPLQELITRSSLAIPIEKGVGLSPKLKSLRNSVDVTANLNKDFSDVALDSDNSENTEELIAKMRAEAEATKNCD